MNWIISAVTNPYLLVSVFSWLFSQVAKFVIESITTKTLDFKRLLGDGGMPSAHSAVVCSIAAYIGLAQGPSSAIFALALILALVVCRDAMGVRRETGKQSAVLSEIVKSISNKSLKDIKLNKHGGHTPLQVVIGGALGIAVAIVMALVQGII